MPHFLSHVINNQRVTTVKSITCLPLPTRLNQAWLFTEISKKYGFMNNPRVSVPVVIVGMVLFMVLCNSHIDIPSELLFTMLVLLHIGLIWMVVTIVRTKPTREVENDLFKDVNLKGDKTF